MYVSSPLADGSNETYSLIRFRAVLRESQLIPTLQLAAKTLQLTIDIVSKTVHLCWVGLG